MEGLYATLMMETFSDYGFAYWDEFILAFVSQRPYGIRITLEIPPNYRYPRIAPGHLKPYDVIVSRLGRQTLYCEEKTRSCEK
jgi:hypothetical protein